MKCREEEKAVVGLIDRQSWNRMITRISSNFEKMFNTNVDIQYVQEQMGFFNFMQK